MPFWESIADGAMERRKLMPRRYVSVRRDGTVFVAMQNPSGARPPHRYLEEVGRIVSVLRAGGC